MAEHVSFPKIGQFRDVVKRVQKASRSGAIVETLTFTGTVKLHGTNSGVVRSYGVDGSSETWFQSRENIITPDRDNYGFATWCSSNMHSVDVLMSAIGEAVGADFDRSGSVVCAYGEWCGQGVQKGVAISNLEKMFVLFGVKIIDKDRSFWLTSEQMVKVAEVHSKNDQVIRHINQFKTWTMDIDFMRAGEYVNKLVEITEAVENECPVGIALGYSGVGEGVVWSCSSAIPDGLEASDLTFKVKGEKHSDSKVAKLASVDAEKVSSFNEFAERVITEHRCEKIIEKMIAAGHAIERCSIPVFLKMVGGDVLDEESDVMEASMLDRKQVMQAVNRFALSWFMDRMSRDF